MKLIDSLHDRSPTRYVSTNRNEDVLPLEEAVVRLIEFEADREEADNPLREVLVKLGFEARCA